MTENFNLDRTLPAMLKQLDLLYTEKNIEALTILFQEVERFGLSLGLTKATGSALLYKHLGDSLAACSFIKSLNVTSVLDVGSGAGFPGLALAAMLPDIHFTLAERRQKRGSFLLSTAALMGLSNVTVFSDDFNLLPGSFDLITFRAVTALNSRTVRDFFKKGALIAAYKGRYAETEAEKAGLEPLADASVIKLSVPFLKEERSLLVVRKLD